MRNFFRRAAEVLRHTLRVIGLVTFFLWVLAFLVGALLLVGLALAPMLPALAASMDDWLRVLFALAFSGMVVVTYPFVAETFAKDATCKSFKRGRVRSMTRNTVLFAAIGNYWAQVPLGPFCLYIIGLLVMYGTAVLSEPKASWNTVFLDWGVKHWLNQASVAMLLCLVLNKSWFLAGVVVLSYFAWLGAILFINLQHQGWQAKKVLKRAFDRQLRTDRVFDLVHQWLRK
jgi:MFS family permease